MSGWRLRQSTAVSGNMHVTGWLGSELLRPAGRGGCTIVCVRACVCACVCVWGGGDCSCGVLTGYQPVSSVEGKGRGGIRAGGWAMVPGVAV